MSRIGKKPVPLAEGVDVQVADRQVTVKGPLGQLSWGLNHGLSVEVKDGLVHVGRSSDTPRLKALHGLTRMEMNNLVEGVTKGYEQTLELTGVGYRAQVQGQTLTLNVGFAHPVTMNIPQGVSASVDKQTMISVKGISKRLVTQVAANIRSVRSPDVYKQKGIKYSGETLIKKAGKAGKK
jgi:large subunit ribosomal protein L6|tara:strand:- start:108 stop:647 length:540 start_codon:yes stop_codon:yes gene_type:complete